MLDCFFEIPLKAIVFLSRTVEEVRLHRTHLAPRDTLGVQLVDEFKQVAIGVFEANERLADLLYGPRNLFSVNLHKAICFLACDYASRLI